MQRIKIKMQMSDVFFRILAAFMTLLILFPFLWLLLSSVKTNAEYYVQPSPFFPSDPQWDRYKYVFIDLAFYKYMINSIFLAAVVVVLNVTSSSFVAYGMARFQFKGKSIVFTVMLMTMFLPSQVSFIPQFLIFDKLEWVNTYLPIVVPHLFGAAANILLVSQFIKAIPKEMDEAAMMDGCNSFSIWLQIILPQSVAVLIVVAISAFLGSWKDSMSPLIYLRDANLYTVPVALMYFQAPDQNSYLLLLTGVVISIIPTLIVYVCLQKWMDKGIFIADLK